MTPASTVRVDRKERYRLGEKLGEGAMGTVYKLVDTETQDDNAWAVKVTEKAKPTKSRRSQAETRARLLHHERQLYEITYSSLRGTVLPKIPSGKNLQVYGESNGWVFLVMEQMEQPLFDAVLQLNPRPNKRIELGPIAIRLVQMIQQIHEGTHVLTDVKPENFMLVAGNGSVAERVRLLDLGLLKVYRYGAKHEPNAPLKEVRGTPLYASLNTHELHSVSRRDDLEALIYLIMDLVIGVHAKQTKKVKNYFRNESYLPWSHGSSDEEIGNLKAAQLADFKSELYQRMPPAAAKILQVCWKKVQAYKYKEEPDYVWFQETLSALAVPVAAHPKPATRKSKKHPLPENGTRRSPRRKTSSARVPAAAEVIVVDDSNDDDVQDMEIDQVWGQESEEEENLKPAAVNEPTQLKDDRQYQAALVVVQNGRLKGKSWVLQEGDDEKFIIGSQPTKRKGFQSIVLSHDDSIDSSHAKIQLKLHKKMLRLDVWDLKSDSGTFINNDAIKGTTNMAAFSGSVIRIGETELLVRRA